MRLLHVADWHLGRLTYNCPRTDDHDAVLAETISIARDFRPDLIVHAGDLFDGVRPSYVELHRGITALKELAVIAPVVVLCGNHDSPALFALFNEMMGDGARIRFVPAARPPSDGGLLEYAAGNEIIRLAPLPYVHPNRTIDHFEDSKEWMSGYADQVGMVQEILGRGLMKDYDPTRHVLLFSAHLHVTGALFSRSERQITVNDAYATRVERLPQVSYAAYGHIHRPQALPGTIPGRYAGSPIALDFGEEGESKSVVLIEAEPGRAAQITVQPLSGGRPLRRVEGTLEEIRAAASSLRKSLCLVTVNTESAIPDLAAQVAEILDGAVVLGVSENCAARKMTVLTRADVSTDREPTFNELFRDYLAAQGTRGGSADRVMTMFEQLIQAVEQEDVFEFPEIAEIERVGVDPVAAAPVVAAAEPLVLVDVASTAASAASADIPKPRTRRSTKKPAGELPPQEKLPL